MRRADGSLLRLSPALAFETTFAAERVPAWSSRRWEIGRRSRHQRAIERSVWDAYLESVDLRARCLNRPLPLVSSMMQRQMMTAS
jgi:hypothetical protein